jgi:hypothetical protein
VETNVIITAAKITRSEQEKLGIQQPSVSSRRI